MLNNPAMSCYKHFRCQSVYVRLAVVNVDVYRIPFYYHGMTLILPWTSYYIHQKMWDKITYSFTNFKGWNGEWIRDSAPHCTKHVLIYPCWAANTRLIFLQIIFPCVFHNSFSVFCALSNRRQFSLEMVVALLRYVEAYIVILPSINQATMTKMTKTLCDGLFIRDFETYVDFD